MRQAATRARIKSRNEVGTLGLGCLIVPHTGATMSIPHYINENKSDIRGIKPGWYAMDDAGKLSSGPFSSREECLIGGIEPKNEQIP
jgi:hypothetical protein